MRMRFFSSDFFDSVMRDDGGALAALFTSSDQRPIAPSELAHTLGDEKGCRQLPCRCLSAREGCEPEEGGYS